MEEESARLQAQVQAEVQATHDANQRVMELVDKLDGVRSPQFLSSSWIFIYSCEDGLG